LNEPDYTGADASAGGCIIDVTMKRPVDREHTAGAGPAPVRTDASAGALARIVAVWLAAMPLPAPAQASLEAAPLPAPFSSARPGTALPPGWEPVKLTDRKKPTIYTLVDDEGTIVLHARAIAAASGLAQFTVFDIRSAPVVEWRWKVSALIDAADNREAAKEDSPVRLLFGFDGDRSRLPLVDRAIFYVTEKLSGRELPYALLEYVWANDLPVGTVIEHPYTRRVRMIVAASGPAGVGAWQSHARNLRDDYRRAFGEEPGPLIGVGVLTDTDNTRTSVDAWYGDIRFVPASR
jgi:hypothetical protein